MSFKGSILQTPCNNIIAGLLPARRQATTSLYGVPSAVLRKTTAVSPFHIVSQRRGKKTTTRVKLNDLPQGVLPSLPSDASDVVPEKSYPPVLQQHLNNIRKYPDCVVLTRIGDFYELYFDQVQQYAPIVNLKQAKRATNLGPVSMAGFQYSQLSRYLKILVKDNALKVAISEQRPVPEADKEGKAGARLFDRQVARIITPGTLIDEDFMDSSENNYLLGVHIDGALPQLSRGHATDDAAQAYLRNTKVGLSWVDFSSGEFFTQVGDLASLPGLVANVRPGEIVLDSSMEHATSDQLQLLLSEDASSPNFHRTPANETSALPQWTPMLERPVPEDELMKFTAQEVLAGNLVLDYARSKLIDMEMKLQPPVRRSSEEFMAIDKQTFRGLEIRSTLRDGLSVGSLLHTIRQTTTKSGGRLLSQRLAAPSTSLPVINNRLDLVEETLNEEALREDIIALLRQTSDTRRLLQRFSINRGDADDLLSLAATIKVIAKMADLLHEHILVRQESGEEMACLWDLLERLDLVQPSQVAKAITDAIDEDGLNLQHSVAEEQRAQTEDMASEIEAADTTGEKTSRLLGRFSAIESPATSDTTTSDIWIMRRSASKTLELAHGDLGKLSEREEELVLQLRKQLRVENLALKWSAKLGHFCHVRSRAVSERISQLEGARAISTTKNIQTFHLPAWTQLGVVIDDAKLRIRKEEERVFDKLRAQVIQSLISLRRNASVLDELDVACSSAAAAKSRNWVRPMLNEGTAHNIVGGRHPTVDAGLQASGRQFINNDCAVGSTRASIYLITGPNMGGKSTYLRQNALITILAQTGCFVPADYAEIGIVDKIFSRVGSADNLYQDQSTFMVEMLETADILKRATRRSFVIMDEVGRGTTPEDGLAVGYAALHHLHNINKCRTLFATHFYALADMTRPFDDVECWCTDVEDSNEDTGDIEGSWSYVHRLRRGVNRKSHALKVARLAGMPEEAANVAAEVLHALRLERRKTVGREEGGQMAIPDVAAVAANG